MMSDVAGRTSQGPRADAGGWARVVTLALAAILLTLSGVTAALRMIVPSDHTWIPPSFIEWHDEGVTVWEIGSGQPDLQRGDMVVAVDGRQLGGRPPLWGMTYRPGDRLVYDIERDGDLRQATVELHPYPVGAALAERWGVFAFTGPLLAMALVVFRRNSTARAAHALLVFAAALAASSVPFVLGIGASDVAMGPLAWLRLVSTNIAFLIGWCGLVALALWFPEPHPAVATRPARAWWVAFGLPLGAFTVAAGVALVVHDSFLSQLSLVLAVQQALIVLCIASAFVLAVLTWRRTTNPVALEQLRWFAGSGCLSAVLVLAGWFLPDLLFGHGGALPDNFLGLAGLPVLVGGTVAVLRYKMFELDIVLNRTLVYGLLTAILASIFGLVAGGVGALVGSLTDIHAAVVAATVVALVVNPLRRFTQRSVNRLFYGDRDEPYLALSRLGRRLEAAEPSLALLPGVAADVAASLRVPFAAIDVIRGETMERVAAVGEPRATPVSTPLVHQSEIVGQLVVSPRSELEPLSNADRRVLADLSSPIGATAANLRLAEHLQRSREGLILAREEERRRLRRELHDGLGPTLSALALQVEAARRKVPHNPVEADATLEQVRNETQKLIDDIRRMAYELRPPTLDEFGLIEALRERAVALEEGSGTRFTVEAVDALPELPAAVEVAAFRIASEAMANVVRHTRAASCTVRVTSRGYDRAPEQPAGAAGPARAGEPDPRPVEEPGGPSTSGTPNALEIEVIDDGPGLSDGYRSGVGISSMQERAAELGGMCSVDTAVRGGARVRATLPLERG